MYSATKLFIGLSIFFLSLAAYWQFGYAYFPLGRLPGDLLIEKENFKFYFPITTCLIVSVSLQLILKLIQFFKG
jgi:hypothetical protein